MSENILKNTTFEDCLLAGEDFDKVNGFDNYYWAFELRDTDGYARPYTKAKLIGYAFGELTEEELSDQDVRWEPKDGNRKNVVLENLIFIEKPKKIGTKEATIKHYENLIKGLKEQD